MKIQSRMLILMSLILLQGCVNLGVGESKSTEHFVLTSLQDTQLFKPSGLNFKLGIGPVELAPYLDRNALVVKTSSNGITFSEYQRWGEPLNDGILRVVSENLSIIFGTEKVYQFPWRRYGDMTYSVKLDISRFEIDTNQQALVSGRWSLHRANGELASSAFFTFQADATTGQQAELSRGLALLCEDIAAAIKNQS